MSKNQEIQTLVKASDSQSQIINNLESQIKLLQTWKNNFIETYEATIPNQIASRIRTVRDLTLSESAKNFNFGKNNSENEQHHQ